MISPTLLNFILKLTGLISNEEKTESIFYPIRGNFGRTTLMITEQSTENKLIGDFFNISTLVIYDLDYFKTAQHTGYATRANNIILSLDPGKIDEKITKARRNMFWGAKSKFLILGKDNSSLIWIERLWNRTKAVNVAVGVLSKPVKYFTWYPYKANECNNVVTLENLDEGNLYPAKITSRNLNQCPIVLLMALSYPYVIGNESESFRNYKGIDANIINIFLQKYNLTEISNYATVSALYFQGIANDGEAQGVIKKLYESTYEIGFCGIHGKLEYNYYTHLVVSYFEDTYSFIIHRPEEIPNIEKLYRSLSPTVWLYILGNFFCLLIILIIVSFFSKSTGVEIILYGFGAYINLPIVLPKALPYKVIFMVTYLYSLHVTTLYQTSLLYYLSNEVREEKIDTVEKAIQKNIDFFMYQSQYPVVIHADWWIPLSQKPNKYHFTRNGMDEYEIIGKKQGLFMSTKASSIHNLRKDGLVDEYGRLLAIVMKEPFRTKNAVILTSPGHPLIPFLDETVQRLLEGGFPDEWYELLLEQDGVKIDREATPFNVEKLAGAFILLVFAHIVTFVVFIVECLVYRVSGGDKRQRNTRKQRILRGEKLF